MIECIKLNDEYQRAFHYTKKKLEELPDEKEFDFSEMYIFGKFNNFCRRLNYIQDIFSTINSYYSLSQSHIEGIEEWNKRYQIAVSNIKKKPYDVLEYRRKEFDEDYEEYKRQIKEIQVATTIVSNYSSV